MTALLVSLVIVLMTLSFAMGLYFGRSIERDARTP